MSYHLPDLKLWFGFFYSFLHVFIFVYVKLKVQRRLNYFQQIVFEIKLLLLNVSASIFLVPAVCYILLLGYFRNQDLRLLNLSFLTSRFWLILNSLKINQWIVQDFDTWRNKVSCFWLNHFTSIMMHIRIASITVPLVPYPYPKKGWGTWRSRENFASEFKFWLDSNTRTLDPESFALLLTTAFNKGPDLISQRRSLCIMEDSNPIFIVGENDVSTHSAENTVLCLLNW